MARDYKLPTNQEVNWSNPHSIPSGLLNVVDVKCRKYLDQPDCASAVGKPSTLCQDLSSILEEVLVICNDFMKLHADSYLREASDQRNVWLLSSTLSEDYQKHINSLPIQVPSDTCPKSFRAGGV